VTSEYRLKTSYLMINSNASEASNGDGFIGQKGIALVPSEVGNCLGY
jgi:hypothetical protein